jgi:hypothetical protein
MERESKTEVEPALRPYHSYVQWRWASGGDFGISSNVASTVLPEAVAEVDGVPEPTLARNNRALARGNRAKERARVKEHVAVMK